MIAGWKIEKIGRFFCFLAMLYFFWRGLTSIVRGGDPIGAALGVIETLVWGVLFAVTFMGLYLDRIGDRLTYGLLWRTERLSAPPLILSEVSGHIVNGEYAEAEQKLLKMQSEYPDHPQLALFLSTLYCDHLHETEKALEIYSTYFARTPRLRGPENQQMLLRFTDMLVKQGKIGQAEIFLRKEELEDAYNKSELTVIGDRLKRLREEV